MKNRKYIILMVAAVSVLLFGTACTKKSSDIEDASSTVQPTSVATVLTEEPTEELTAEPTAEPDGQENLSYEKATLAEDLDNMITSAEQKADEYEEILFNTSNVTQAELNEAAANLYEVWDDLINEEWAMLKENLDSATLAKVKEEQLDWISYKEQAAKDAGAEAEGGSMYSMLVNHKVAELTKDRVYELAEYLK